MTSVTDILSVIQNGVQAVNNLTLQLKSIAVGSQITNLATQTSTLATQVSTLATQVAAINKGFFSVNLSSDQAAGGSNFVINYTVEDFDTDNWYNTGTLRFQPTEAGYYYIYNQVEGNGAPEAEINKNGSLLREGSWCTPGITQQVSVISDLIFMNGTTDYIELTAFSTGSTIFQGAGTHAFGYKIGP